MSWEQLAIAVTVGVVSFAAGILATALNEGDFWKWMHQRAELKHQMRLRVIAAQEKRDEWMRLDIQKERP